MFLKLVLKSHSLQEEIYIYIYIYIQVANTLLDIVVDQ